MTRPHSAPRWWIETPAIGLGGPGRPMLVPIVGLWPDGAAWTAELLALVEARESGTCWRAVSDSDWAQQAPLDGPNPPPALAARSERELQALGERLVELEASPDGRLQGLRHFRARWLVGEAPHRGPQLGRLSLPDR